MQNYLEKRLFGKNRSSKPPSVWEILPSRRIPVNNIQEVINGTNAKEKETLQTVESERVSAYEDYDDYLEPEGKIIQMLCQYLPTSLFVRDTCLFSRITVLFLFCVYLVQCIFDSILKSNVEF